MQALHTWTEVCLHHGGKLWLQTTYAQTTCPSVDGPGKGPSATSLHSLRPAWSLDGARESRAKITLSDKHLLTSTWGVSASTD